MKTSMGVSSANQRLRFYSMYPLFQADFCERSCCSDLRNVYGVCCAFINLLVGSLYSFLQYAQNLFRWLTFSRISIYLVEDVLQCKNSHQSSSRHILRLWYISCSIHVVDIVSPWEFYLLFLVFFRQNRIKSFINIFFFASVPLTDGLYRILIASCWWLMLVFRILMRRIPAEYFPVSTTSSTSPHFAFIRSKLVSFFIAFAKHAFSRI